MTLWRCDYVAAARAAETEREDAFVRDPLAAILAGEKAVRERRAALSKGSSARPATGELPSATAPQRPITRIVFRTVWFDRAIQTAVGLKPPPFFEGFRAALGDKVCTQVGGTS